MSEERNNVVSKIRIISVGQKIGNKYFYVLNTDYAADINSTELALLFGEDYADKILGGSVIYTADLTVQVWNEDLGEFQ